MTHSSDWSLSGRQILTTCLGIAVSALILGWAFYQVDVQEAIRTLQRFGARWIVPMLLVYLGSFLVRGLRWQLLLRPVEKVSWLLSTGVIFSGYMANNLLPLRLGELVRAIVLGQITPARVEGTLSTIVLERVFDGLVLVGIIGLVMLGGRLDGGSETVVYVGTLSALLFAGALLFLMAARTFPDLLLTLARWTLDRLPLLSTKRGLEAVRSLLRGLEALALNGQLLVVAVLSVAVWLLEGGMFWIGLHAFSLNADPSTAFLCLAFVNLSILIPSAPGYIGVFQGGTLLAFSVFGLSEEVALSYSLVVHTLQYVSVTTIGVAVLAVLGISFSSIRRESLASERAE